MSAVMPRLTTPSGVAVLDGLLNETIALAAEARCYLSEGGDPPRRETATALTPLIEACELSRLSARLGFCISWLLARRAVHEGMLSPEEGRERRWRLDGTEICLDTGIAGSAELPQPLRDMLDRSLALYRRVARLDRRLDP